VARVSAHARILLGLLSGLVPAGLAEAAPAPARARILVIPRLTADGGDRDPKRCWPECPDGPRGERRIETAVTAALAFFPTLERAWGDRIEERLLTCGTHLDCAGGVIEDANADLALEVAVDRSSPPLVLLALTLIDRHGKERGRGVAELERGDEDRAIQREVSRLLGGAGLVRHGRLVIESPSGGLLLVDGLMREERDLLLTPGSHAIAFVGAGSAQTVQIEAGQVVHLALASPPLLVAEPPSDEGLRWAWIGGGAAVVATAVVIAAVLVHNHAQATIPGTDGKTISTLRGP
jgi:hypothetical protein